MFLHQLETPLHLISQDYHALIQGCVLRRHLLQFDACNFFHLMTQKNSEAWHCTVLGARIWWLCPHQQLCNPKDCIPPQPFWTAMALNCVHNKHIKYMAHLAASIHQWDSQTTKTNVKRNLSLSMSLDRNTFEHRTQVCNKKQLSEIRVQKRWLPNLAMPHLLYCIVLDYRMIDNDMVYFLIRMLFWRTGLPNRHFQFCF